MVKGVSGTSSQNYGTTSSPVSSSGSNSSSSLLGRAKELFCEDARRFHRENGAHIAVAAVATVVVAGVLGIIFGVGHVPVNTKAVEIAGGTIGGAAGLGLLGGAGYYINKANEEREGELEAIDFAGNDMVDEAKEPSGRNTPSGPEERSFDPQRPADSLSNPMEQ